MEQPPTPLLILILRGFFKFPGGLVQRQRERKKTHHISTQNPETVQKKDVHVAFRPGIRRRHPAAWP